MPFPGFTETLLSNLPAIVETGREIFEGIFGDEEQESVSRGTPSVVRAPSAPARPIQTQVVLPGQPRPPAAVTRGTSPGFVGSILRGAAGAGVVDIGLCLARGGSLASCVGLDDEQEGVSTGMPGAAGAPSGTVPMPMGAGGGGCIFPQATRPSSRYPSTVQFLDMDANGNTRCITYKNMGRPLLFAGDVSAARRVDRVARRARRASRKR